MTLELTKQQRADAVVSLQRYAERNMPEPLGELGSGLLLNFFLEEIGPLIYNKAISDAQSRLQLLVSEVDSELYAEPFTYWAKAGKLRSRS